MSMTEDELEFDMWDGQFEFLGNNYHNYELDDRQNTAESNRTYDTEADLVFGPVTDDVFQIDQDNLIEFQMTQKHRKKGFDKTAKNVRMPFICTCWQICDINT